MGVEFGRITGADLWQFCWKGRRGDKSEKPGSEPDEAKLQTASRRIVQNAILRAVQQVSRESQSRRRDARAGDSARGSLRPGAGEAAKKHEK
ncbi:hypothetical protein FD755_009914 [Muntiacus reevesi]|uniref:A-kinase anchor protein 7 RI-RII subunit-binding domain-containing protein n=1 Tax=Muntiacus reevesi TaxID=9886 RepID=A0A5N3Y092_MUNRE|nr:hypothetical protein FD755_009914 [Muntiacus reevesi]